VSFCPGLAHFIVFKQLQSTDAYQYLRFSRAAAVASQKKKKRFSNNNIMLVPASIV